MKNMQEIFDAVENTESLYHNVYSINDTVTLNSAEYYQGGANAGVVPTNPDGSIAQIPAKYLSVDPAQLYLNKYRVVNNKLEVVCGAEAYLCLKAKNAGSLIPQREVPVYVLQRNSKKELVCKDLTTVSDKEFMESFNSSLDFEAMKEILPIVKSFGLRPQADKMPI